MSRPEPQFDESRDGTERATKVVAEQGGLPDDNPFSEIVRDLRDEGESWRDIYDTAGEVFGVLDDAAFEEGVDLMADWGVTVVKPDPDTPSGERYERYERTAETAAEAEEMVKRKTGYPVDSEQTEQVGYSKVG
ncbi:hypothetical protein [Halostella litorea]|uniref:hypothetical protein n=1 Tax=Halostella litorea TaxID=2528831 RepID=UPI0010930308|nr:hypothetical protein [Halostella litorea]